MSPFAGKAIMCYDKSRSTQHNFSLIYMLETKLTLNVKVLKDIL